MKYLKLKNKISVLEKKIFLLKKFNNKITSPDSKLMKLLLKSFLPFVFTLLFFFTFSSVNAQFANKDYQMESIYLKGGKYIKNGIEYPQGFLSRNLKQEMKISPNALMEYKKFERNRNIGLVISSIGIAVLSTSIYYRQRDISVTPYIAVGLSLASIPFSVVSINHLHKAIWIRNGDVLK